MREQVSMIQTISLENFKCFEFQDIPLRNLTLLTGLNGMGKSSILQTLLLLRQSYLDGLLTKNKIELNGSLIKMGTAKDVLYEGAERDEIGIGISWDDGNIADFRLRYDREADVLNINPQLLNDALFEKNPFSGAFHYLQAERLGPRVMNAVSDFHVRELRQLGSAGEYALHFLEVYNDEKVCCEQLFHEASNGNKLLSQTEAWLSDISPGTQIHLETHPEMDVVNLRYSFPGSGGLRSIGSTYRPTAVGFGLTYVLPVLIAILSSKPGSLVLLENPEAHLHPRGQARMGVLLAKAAAAGIQIVVETHSDHVLNGLRVAARDGIVSPESVAVHYFSRQETEKGGSYSVVNSPEMDADGRFDDWPEGFFDEWDTQLERLLSPRSER